MWNINCGNKLSDVICQPQKLTKQRSKEYLPVQEAHDKFVVHIASDVVASKASSKQGADQPSSFKELGIGDPSRNVIEKIFGAALISSTKEISKINRVLKVRNSHKVVEFEKYRNMVKQKAKESEQKHPIRTLVDGNELLCFYVTTMTCYNRKLKWAYSRPCEDSNCNLCRTIGFSFEADYEKRFDIELSMSSEALSERLIMFSRAKKVKRVVIICRIIAGRTRSMEDDDKRSEDEFDSIRKRGFSPNSEYLIVNNPNAVLPCFVVVLN